MDLNSFHRAARDLALGTLCASLAISANAQVATFTPFGGGCYGATISGTPPRLGTNAQLVYQGPNTYNNPHGGNEISDRPILVLGFSNQTAGSLQLPWALPGPISLGNCQLLVSNDFVHVMEYDLPSGPVRFVGVYQYAVPSSSSYLGLQLYAQWLVRHYDNIFYSPPYEAYGTSNAATLVLGF